MKTDAHIKSGSFSMKRLQVLPLVLGLFIASTAVVANAQSSAGMPQTRAQIKMERDEFLKSHRWDSFNDNWVLMPEFEAPSGMKSRAEVLAERDEFLRNNRWDEASTDWVPLKGKPRDLSTMTREQIRADTQQFVRTHRWNGETQAWVEQTPRMKK